MPCTLYLPSNHTSDLFLPTLSGVQSIEHEASFEVVVCAWARKPLIFYITQGKIHVAIVDRVKYDGKVFLSLFTLSWPLHAGYITFRSPNSFEGKMALSLPILCIILRHLEWMSWFWPSWAQWYVCMPRLTPLYVSPFLYVCVELECFSLDHLLLFCSHQTAWDGYPLLVRRRQAFFSGGRHQEMWQVSPTSQAKMSMWISRWIFLNI